MLASRLLGRTLKLFADLMPKSLKSYLKKHDGLFNFYGQTLKRSGFFYGFPTQKEYNKAYQRVLKFQAKHLASLPESNKAIFDLVILVPIGKVNSLQKTLLNVPKSLVIHIVCRKEDLQKVESETKGKYGNEIEIYSSPVTAVNSKNPILLIYAGQLVREYANKIFYDYANEYDILFTDKDWKTDKQHHNPMLLPDWNPDLQLTSAYIRTGLWVKNQENLTSIISNHAQTVAEMAASIYLNLKDNDIKVGHIPFSLVHETETRKFNYGNYANTLSNWVGKNATITVDTDIEALTWHWEHDSPLVSIIIPTYNAKQLVQQCIDSILRSTYQNFEIILVDNLSDDPDCIEYFSSLNDHAKIRVLEYKHPFNYSAINNFAVKHASGEIIALVNNDIKVIDNSWLDSMVSHACRPDIGCVGAKLLYEDERIQHAGVILGYGGGAGHAFKFFPRYHPGYLKRLLVTQNYSAVTAACLLVKKSDYDAVKGLNETELAIAFNDVDFCLRVSELGRRNLYCAETELYHYESISRGLDTEPEKQKRFQSELKYIKRRWKTAILHDPAYNPNLTLKRENFIPKLKEEY